MLQKLDSSCWLVLWEEGDCIAVCSVVRYQGGISSPFLGLATSGVKLMEMKANLAAWFLPVWCRSALHRRGGGESVSMWSWSVVSCFAETSGPDPTKINGETPKHKLAILALHFPPCMHMYAFYSIPCSFSVSLCSSYPDWFTMQSNATTERKILYV